MCSMWTTNMKVTEVWRERDKLAAWRYNKPLNYLREAC